MTDIKVDWKNRDTIPDWNEKCIRVIESFGLPGNKYMTQVTEDYMIFSFIEAEDALMARLIIGG
jgi:hypothetical protein